MLAPLKSLLNSSGKSDRQVAAVFAFDPCACHKVVSYLREQQPNIPVWLFSTVQPADETAALCERTVVHRNATALFLQAEIALWQRWVVLCAGTWTGEPGKWLLKLAPFFIPPFRVLLLNRSGDFMPGRLGSVLLHGSRCWRDRAEDLASTCRDLGPNIWRSGPCTRVKDMLAAIALLATATLLRCFGNPHRALFHRLHGAERLRLPHVEDVTASLVLHEQQRTGWNAPSLRRLVESTGARWILWRSEADGGGSIDQSSVDAMLRFFDDDCTFAVSLPSHMRGWKPVLFATAPFRKLQPGEATRLLAPLSGTILVSRKKLEALGVPDCGLATAAWLLLFWKAAAAGWHSYSLGHGDAVTNEPEFPVQETAFIFRVLSNTALRLLGPIEPELSRGNIAFKWTSLLAVRPTSQRLRVLVVSPFLPYPLSHGGAVRIYNLCRALADRVDFGLVAVREAGDSVDYAKLQDIFRNVWVVDLDETESDNARLPRQVRRYESSSLRSLVGHLCHSWKPDLLQVEYTHLAGLRENAAGVPAILVEHDVTLGLYRQLAQNEPSKSAEREYKIWLAFEREWLRAYDAVWTVSDQERQDAIQHGARSERTFTVPNGVDTVRFQPCECRVLRPELLYVGSFRHLPNILAFEKLCAEIMPQVWARFPATVLRVVAGPNHERFLQMLRPSPVKTVDKRVEVLGFVEDLRPLYARAAVVVAPLAISSGTNIKVLEAMACGKAIVSTPAGCAGLGLEDGHDVFIRADSSEFARSVCQLLGDESIRARVGSYARRKVEERFCWEAVAERAFDSYLKVLGRGEKVPVRARHRNERPPQRRFRETASKGRQ